MSTLMSEEDFKKKQKKFTILGIILIILGFSLFFAGPILTIITNKFYLFFLSFLGVIMFVPGFLLLSLGTQRKLAAYQAQAVGPVSVDVSEKYGKEVVKNMAEGVKEAFDEKSEYVYCKYCGEKIDKDSEFCKYCGKKQ